MRVLVYGASNVWGFMPGSYDPTIFQGKQYPQEQRWTTILEKQLPGVEVVVDGLSGRTTAFPDTFAGKPYRNGLRGLPEALDKHVPADLVVFFLGTNDLKIQQDKTVEESAEGMRHLVNCVKVSKVSPEGKAPKVLVIAPQPIGEGYGEAYFDAKSVEKSLAVPAAFQAVALAEGADFLNTVDRIPSSPKDGIHLEPEGHQALGDLAAEKIRAMYPEHFGEAKADLDAALPPAPRSLGAAAAFAGVACSEASTQTDPVSEVHGESSGSMPGAV